MKSKIFIHKNFVIDKVEDNIFGGFIEHLGRAVYTGIYEPEHPTADENGFRNDVKELVKDLNMPITRYPGGNFVSGFNWLDAIGPQAERPVRADYAWRGIEPNTIGIDEFMKWCKDVGTVPVYTVNLGTNTPKAAQEIVEYCNFPGGTYWSDLRRKNGTEKPHDIKYWCLGNEMDGDWQIGHKTAEEYGRIAHEAAKMMKMVDRSIILCACGSSSCGMPTFAHWDEEIMRHLHHDVDYLSIHHYFGNIDRNFPKFFASPEALDHQIESAIACCDAAAAKLKSMKKTMRSLDEWNVWYRGKSIVPGVAQWECASPILEETYDMADVLVTGGALLSMIDHADRLKMACIAQTVNVIAPIMTQKGGKAWKQSIYYPLLETSRYGRGTAMRVINDSPEYEVEGFYTGKVKYLRSSAVLREEDGEITIFAINRADETMDFSAELAGFDVECVIEAKEIHNPDLDAVNTPEEENVSSKLIDRSQYNLSGNILEATLKPYSWNMFRIKIQNV